MPGTRGGNICHFLLPHSTPRDDILEKTPKFSEEIPEEQNLLRIFARRNNLRGCLFPHIIWGRLRLYPLNLMQVMLSQGIREIKENGGDVPPIHPLLHAIP